MTTRKDPVRFTPAPCPQCGDAHGVVRSATTTPGTADTPSGMNISVECPSCHHMWLQPMPSAGKRDPLPW